MNKLANPDGSPLPPKAGASQRRFEPAAQPALMPCGTERLRDWLNRLAELGGTAGLDHETAYLALLQSWLDLNGISWPSKGVFAADLSSGGKGRPIDKADAELRKRCYELRKQGKTWQEVARVAFPKCATVPERVKAQRKAKDYAKSYKTRRRDRPDMEDFRDDACELLGIERHPSFDDL